MEEELFKELLESVKQGAAIINGDLPASRKFEFVETEVHAHEYKEYPFDLHKK